MSKKHNLDHFIALRPDFVLDADGKKPYLYPVDFNDQTIFRLSPGQAFALSLFDGKTTTAEIITQFATIIPNASASFVLDTVDIINELIRLHPTTNGLGSDGAIIESAQPIAHAYSYDPRKFIISNKIFEEEVLNLRTSFRLGRPINILAVPTYRCQTNCVYCYAERADCQEMPLRRWQELFAEMTQLDIHLISFDNGDTFARRDGTDILELALANEMHFMISTKSLVTKDQVHRLIDAGLKKPVRYILERTVQLSVDAIDDDLVRKIYGSKVYKDNITATFDNFIAHGITPKIKGVMMPQNAHQVEKIVTHFYERGARVFQFVPYIRSFFRHTDDLFLTKPASDKVYELMQRCHEKFPDAWIGIDRDFQYPAENPTAIDLASRKALWDKRAGCGGGWSALGINADGKAFLCEQMTLKDEYCVGNLMQQSIEEVWNSERMFEFIYPRQAQFAGTVCESCDEFAACHWVKGYCHRDAYFSYGTIFDAPPLCPKQTNPGLPRFA